MSTFKKHKIVMLPAAEANLKPGDLYSNGKVIGVAVREYSKQHGYVLQHLYVVSSEEIKDMAIADNTHCMFFPWMHEKHPCQAGKDIGRIRTAGKYFEIIASTDSTLNLPGIPEEFLKAYCTAGGIEDVEVEYKDWCDYDYDDDNPSGMMDRPDWRLRLLPENTISIRSVAERTFTKEDLKAAYRAGTWAMKDPKCWDSFEEWFAKTY